MQNRFGVGCRFKAICPHVGLGSTGGRPSEGTFLKMQKYNLLETCVVKAYNSIIGIYILSFIRYSSFPNLARDLKFLFWTILFRKHFLIKSIFRLNFVKYETWRCYPSSRDSWAIAGKLWKPLANGGLACQ